MSLLESKMAPLVPSDSAPPAPAPAPAPAPLPPLLFLVKMQQLGYIVRHAATCPGCPNTHCAQARELRLNHPACQGCNLGEPNLVNCRDVCRFLGHNRRCFSEERCPVCAPLLFGEAHRFFTLASLMGFPPPQEVAQVLLKVHRNAQARGVAVEVLKGPQSAFAGLWKPATGWFQGRDPFSALPPGALVTLEGVPYLLAFIEDLGGPANKRPCLFSASGFAYMLVSNTQYVRSLIIAEDARMRPIPQLVSDILQSQDPQQARRDWIQKVGSVGAYILFAQASGAVPEAVFFESLFPQP